MDKVYEPAPRVSFILYKAKGKKTWLVQGCGEQGALIELCKLRNIDISKCKKTYRDGVFYLEVNERGK